MLTTDSRNDQQQGDNVTTPKIKALSAIQKTMLSQAKDKKFIVQKPTQGEVFDAYYKWCKSLNLPLVKVRLKRKYAFVRVDMITTDQKLNARGQAEIMTLLRNAEAKNQKEGTILGFCGSEICDNNWIPIELYEEIAAELFKMATNPAYIEPMN